jgi:hypothetical protein
MFEDEDEEINDGNFNEYLDRFERSLKGESSGFIDSDQIEILIYHYMMNGMYYKANICADLGKQLFPFNKLFFKLKMLYSQVGTDIRFVINAVHHILIN